MELVLGNPDRMFPMIARCTSKLIYIFVGYLDQASSSIAVLDTDCLESPGTRELNGVFYPVWSSDFTLSFNWEPTVFAINDGQNSATALFTTQTYGASADETLYSVDGIYTFADTGDSVNSRLDFEDGTSATPSCEETCK